MLKIKFLLFIFLLIVADQVLKLFINIRYLEKNIILIKNLLYFKPMFNREYSWVNAILNLNIGKSIHIISIIIIFTISIIIFILINEKNINTKLIDTLFVLIFSGSICSFLDKLIWNGSLDYIYLKNFFIFDLKDLYIIISIIIISCMVLVNYKGINKLNNKYIIVLFIKYIKKKFTKDS